LEEFVSFPQSCPGKSVNLVPENLLRLKIELILELIQRELLRLKTALFQRELRKAGIPMSNLPFRATPFATNPAFPRSQGKLLPTWAGHLLMTDGLPGES
jgi:hypothetical protein